MKKRKKIFFDLEFSGLHKLTTAVSIGLVAEDGREFYAEFTDYDEHQIDEWLHKNIMSKLILNGYSFEQHYDPEAETVHVKGDTELIKNTLTEWLEPYKEDGIEMWGDCLAYDWVLFIGIFGNAFDIPSHIYYLPMDICTALKLCGEDPDINREEYAYGKDDLEGAEKDKHNALADARTQMEVYKKLFAKLTNAGNESLGAAEEPEQGEEANEVKNEVVSLEAPPEETVHIPNPPQAEFVEPTQQEINQSTEWNPPV